VQGVPYIENGTGNLDLTRADSEWWGCAKGWDGSKTLNQNL